MLHIETGHPVTADAKRIEGTTVRFVTEDGRTMFEIRANNDGRSIEVSAVDTTKVGGLIYDGTLALRPRSANSITVGVSLYEGMKP